MRARMRTWNLSAVALTAALALGCGNVVGGGGDDATGGDTTGTDASADAAGSDAGANDGTDAADALDSASDTGAPDDAGSPDVGADASTADVADDTSAPDVAQDASASDTAEDIGATDAADDGSAPDAAVDAVAPDDAGAPDAAIDAVAPDDGGAPDAAEDATSPDTAPDAAEDAGPPPGCCNVDLDCGKSQVCFFGPWNAGKCMDITSLDKGTCWTDAQCGQGEHCEDAMACGCKALCKAMDKPGTCKLAAAKACSVGLGADTLCPEGEFCALPGTCSGNGVCTPKPQGCIALYDPVCGCDGKTHGNACAASSAGVNVAGKGACEPPNPCLTMKCGDGNSCTADQCNPKTGQCEFPPLTGQKCDDGNLCSYDDLCAESNGKGYCQAGNEVICPPPLPCQLVSCNGKTGKCETQTDPACGGGGAKCSLGLGAPTIDCGADGYCKLPGGTCTGFGSCEPKPMACLAVYKPVCGCNGKTYGNDCEAGSAGENYGSSGECGGGGGVGCCKDDSQCKTGLCANNVCKDPGELKAGMCWNDAQCAAGSCIGASICPCGAACFAADKPGTCQNK